MTRDGGQPATATRTLLDRVKSGTTSVALGMTGNGAYDGVMQLLQRVFPAF